MEINRLVSNSTADIEKLFLKVFSTEPWNEEWSIQMVRKRIGGLLINPMAIAYAAYNGYRMTGALIGHKTNYMANIEFYIDEFFVDTSMQRTGIGTSILNYVENDLKKERISSLSLLTMHGYPSEAFYLNNNFKRLENLIYMHKSI